MTQGAVAAREPFAVKVESGGKWFCRCKQTNNRPFCDGSHKKL